MEKIPQERPILPDPRICSYEVGVDTTTETYTLVPPLHTDTEKFGPTLRRGESSKLEALMKRTVASKEYKDTKHTARFYLVLFRCY